jgi:transposase
MGRVLYVGIDLAETEPHRAAILDDDKILSERRVEPNARGLASLLAEIAKYESENSRVLVAVERPDGLFVGELLQRGYTVYPINPKAMERYRDRFKLAGTKTDSLDARCLASLLRTDRDAYRPLRPDSDRTRELRMLTRDLADLTKTRTMLVLQLRAALLSAFPAAVEVFSDLSAPSALSFLRAFPSLQQAQAATDDQIAAALKAGGYPRPEIKVAELRAILHKPQLMVDAAVASAKRILIVTLVETLLPLGQQIKAYDKRVDALFKDHPDREVFLSLPGAGPRLAARLAAELGDHCERFPSAREVAAFSGMAPVTRQSGKTRTVVFRRACCKPFREVMHQFGFCSLSRAPWARIYYDVKRAEGKRHAEALRCLGMKWLRIIHAMWTNHTPYDPTRISTAAQASPARKAG